MKKSTLYKGLSYITAVIASGLFLIVALIGLVFRLIHLGCSKVNKLVDNITNWLAQNPVSAYVNKQYEAALYQENKIMTTEEED